jgi:hypothetical protein
MKDEKFFKLFFNNLLIYVPCLAISGLIFLPLLQYGFRTYLITVLVAANILLAIVLAIKNG